MLFYALGGLINAIGNTLLGLFVYLKNKRARVNQTFALFCLSTAIWSYGYYFWQVSNNANMALFWSRVLMAGAIFIPIFYLHFILTFLNKISENKKLLIGGYLLNLLFFILNFTDLFIKEIKPELFFKFWPKPGIFYHPFLIVWFIYLIYSIFLLYTESQKSIGIKRTQIKILLAGILIGTVGGATNYFLWYGIPIPPIGNIFVILYAVFTAYAILRYRLMDIRLVVRQITIYGVSLIFSIGLSILLMMLALNYLSFYISSPWIGSVILIFGIIVFQFIKERFSKFANKHLFFTLYNYEKTLGSLTEKLSRSIDLNNIIDLTSETIRDVMKLDKIALVLRKLELPKGQLKLIENNHNNHSEKLDDLKNNKDGNFYLAKTIDFENEKINSLIKNKFALNYLEHTKLPLIKDEIRHLVEESINETMNEKLTTFENFMKENEAELYLPLLIENRLIGLFVLSKKVSGDSYTIQDLSLLETVANQIAIAINNAQLYEQSQYFNQTLQARIVEATQELAGAYRELKKLDDSKTEFLSLASHQLRTPLSAIKGYLSMVLEGSYGKLQKETEVALTDVYQSNERLITLVNDLLNITRIEAGQLEYNSKEIDFTKLIESVIKELEKTAQNKNLELKYKLSKIPKVNIDPDKIRQVLMNLIDNAIKYTEKGNVTVQVKKVDGKIVTTIKDTGIGITDRRAEHLFQWFSRGKGAIRLDSGGFGLGLYIAKKIIEKANGKIWAESKGKNKGSTFAFELPIK